MSCTVVASGDIEGSEPAPESGNTDLKLKLTAERGWMALKACPWSPGHDEDLKTRMGGTQSWPRNALKSALKSVC